MATEPAGAFGWEPWGHKRNHLAATDMAGRWFGGTGFFFELNQQQMYSDIACAINTMVNRNDGVFFGSINVKLRGNSEANATQRREESNSQYMGVCAVYDLTTVRSSNVYNLLPINGFLNRCIYRLAPGFCGRYVLLALLGRGSE